MVGIHQFFMILVVLHMAMICLQKTSTWSWVFREIFVVY